MRTRAFLGFVVGFWFALATACTGPAAPADDVELREADLPGDDYELPEPDPSLDPDRLTLGDYIATPCAFQKFGNGLAHLRGKHEWALVDVFFGRRSPDDPRDGPTAGDLDLVRSHGGRVLYRFNVPAVRARMILSRIPGLVEEGFWVTVRDVPDATRYDVKLSVGFARPLRDADVDLFVSLGGRVDYRWDFIDALNGVLPDRSIPVFQERSDVRYVQVNSVSCLA